MTRDEAKQMLGCSLADLAKKLKISTAAVAQWGNGDIPALREYQVIELARVSTAVISVSDLSPTLEQKAADRNI